MSRADTNSVKTHLNDHYNTFEITATVGNI